MPRLDKGAADVVEVLEEWEGLEVPEGPVDICADCFAENHFMLFEAADVEHPDYEDWDYSCYFCGEVLNRHDD